MERAGAERKRAVEAGRVADRYEGMAAVTPGVLGEIYLRMVKVQRDLETRHTTAAQLHTRYANSLKRQFRRAVVEPRRALFMAALAETSRADEAAVTMFGGDRIEALAGTSGPLARAAQDLEYILGEGPSHESATAQRPVFAVGSAILTNWPSYGTAVRPLGVQLVAAVPLDAGSGAFGSLAVFNPWSTDRDEVLATVRAVADAFTRTIVVAAGGARINRAAPFFDEVDFHDDVFQAAGKLMIQCRCSLADALALIRARAYADDTSAAVIAARIVTGELRFDDAI